jgi:hypothetical protein
MSLSTLTSRAGNRKKLFDVVRWMLIPLPKESNNENLETERRTVIMLKEQGRVSGMEYI